jgi:hypothetical protein
MVAPRVVIGAAPVTESEPDEPISCKPSDKCPHGVFRREYCSLCPEFVGYSEPIKKRQTVKGTTVLGRESADVYQCSCNGAACHQCKPYTPAYRRRSTLSHARRMWVEVKTDHNGHPVRPQVRMREIYTLETHQFRLAQEFRFNHPASKREIPDHPLRGWLAGLGKSNLASGLYKLSEPALKQATEYMRWIRGLQHWGKATVADLSPFLKAEGKNPNKMCWCSYKAVLKWRPRLTAPRIPEWAEPPLEYRQNQPARMTRKQLVDMYRKISIRPSKSLWRLREEASWHRLLLSALPDDLPYEPFELAYPYCERNPASRWPRIWVGPSVMPRLTVYNSAVGLEFTDRTLADARRSYLISQPLLADLWGCSQRTVWARLQEVGGCACRVCLAAKMPEFRRLLYRAIFATMPAVIMWRGEVGSQEAKRQQRKLDKRRALTFDFGSFAEGWGWDKKREE